MPTPSQIEDDTPLAAAIRDLAAQRSRLEEDLEDAYEAADAAEIEYAEVLKAARAVIESEDEHPDHHGIVTYSVEPLRVFFDDTLTTPSSDRGRMILELLADMAALVGHGNYCDCDKTGKPCAIDAVKVRYANLFPRPRESRG